MKIAPMTGGEAIFVTIVIGAIVIWVLHKIVFALV